MKVSYYTKLSGRTRNNNPPESCTVNGCDNKHLAKGYCRKHYYAYRRWGVDEMLVNHHSYASKGLIKKNDMREYRAWCEMKRRCDNPNRPRYKDYGGRGIKYCTEWESFDKFLLDMGECPDGMTLDRIDVDGDYCKENCRWTDYATQNRNKRNNVKYNGELLSDLIVKKGMKVSTFYNRANSKGVTPLELWEKEYE